MDDDEELERILREELGDLPDASGAADPPLDDPKELEDWK